MGAVPESNIRDTLTANGWRIDFLGPTSYVGNAAGFGGGYGRVPTTFRPSWPSSSRRRRLEQMRDVAARFEKIAELLDDDRVHMPFTVVHAHRVD